ncbi:hypothetical protein HQ584_01765 [Patescibacteria group bacterium]|nr:hypothetical protein [Patescibacteria group bacterium]
MGQNQQGQRPVSQPSQTESAAQDASAEKIKTELAEIAILKSSARQRNILATEKDDFVMADIATKELRELVKREVLLTSASLSSAKTALQGTYRDLDLAATNKLMIASGRDYLELSDRVIETGSTKTHLHLRVVRTISQR